MSRYRLSLWSWLSCDGGELIAPVLPDQLVAGSYQRSIDGSDEAEIEVTGDAWWVGELSRNRVIRIDDAVLGTSEWLVRHVVDQYGAAPITRVWCAPVDDLLRMCGPVRHVVTGGRTYYALGSVSVTPHQQIDTWILPALADAGYGFFSRGSISSRRLLSMGWDRQTPLQLLNGLAVMLSQERRLRRDAEDGYAIDLLDRVGDELPAVLLTPGRNLLSLIRTRGEGMFATELIPLGMARGGSGARWGIEEASLYVASVDSGVIEVRPRNHGEGLILADDCYAGLYLEAANGAREEILACDAAAQTVTVGNASDFAEDDDVTIVLDAAGTRLSALSHADAIAEYGREVVTETYDALRGERNHIRNPFFSDHDGVEGSIPGGYLQNGLPVPGKPGFKYYYDHGSPQSGTVITIGDWPPGWVLAAGETIRFVAPPPVDTTVLYEIVTGDTADGGGSATVELDQSVSLPAQFGALHYYDNALSATYPRHWISDGLLARLRPTSAQSITGALVGTHTDATTIFVDGLTPGDIIYPWTLVQFASNPSGKRTLVSEIATVDEDGAVTLFCTLTNELTGASGAMDGADNEGVTLSRPEITGRVGNWCLVVGDGSPGAGQDPINQQVIIPHYAGMPPVVFSAQITLWNTSNQTRALGTNLTKASIGVYDATGATPIITLTDPSTGNIESGGVRTVTLAVEVDVTATTEYQFRITAAGTTGGLQNRTLRTIVHWSTAYAQADPEESIPPVVGSFGTEIAQAGVAALRRAVIEPVVYETTIADLASQDGYDPATEAVALGTPFLTGVPELDLARELRCVRIRPDLVDEARTGVTLATIPVTLSTATPAPPTQWTAAEAAVAATLRQPPAEVAGAYRAIGRWQQPMGVPDDPDVLPIEPYEAA